MTDFIQHSIDDGTCGRLHGCTTCALDHSTICSHKLYVAALLAHRCDPKAGTSGRLEMALAKALTSRLARSGGVAPNRSPRVGQRMDHHRSVAPSPKRMACVAVGRGKKPQPPANFPARRLCSLMSWS